MLNARLPGQQRGVSSIWNEKGAFLSPYRTVLLHEAPEALARLDDALPGQIGQGNYIKAEYDGRLLEMLRGAYEEAQQKATR